MLLQNKFYSIRPWLLPVEVVRLNVGDFHAVGNVVLMIMTVHETLILGAIAMAQREGNGTSVTSKKSPNVCTNVCDGPKRGKRHECDQ